MTYSKRNLFSLVFLVVSTHTLNASDTHSETFWGSKDVYQTVSLLAQNPDLRHLTLNNIPDNEELLNAIFSLSNLQSLSLSFKKNATVQIDVFSLTNHSQPLETLSLPQSILNLSYLRCLKLSNRKLSSQSIELLSQFTNLRELTIEYPETPAAQNFIGTIVHLEKLSLRTDKNPETQLSITLAQLSDLQEIILDGFSNRNETNNQILSALPPLKKITFSGVFSDMTTNNQIQWLKILERVSQHENFSYTQDQEHQSRLW